MQIKYSDKLTREQKVSVNHFKSYLSEKPTPKPTKPILTPEPPKERSQVHLHDIMTPGEVCEYLSISRMTLKRWQKAGRIDCIRINSRGDRRYLRSEIERILGGTK